MTLVDPRVTELVRRGMSHAQAFAAVYPRVRVDSADAVSAHHRAAMHSIMVAQKMGTRRAARKMPRQNYPRANEAAYGSRIVALVHKARRAYDPLVKELPQLLERARAARGDDVQDGDVAGTLAEFAGYNQSVAFAGFTVVVENQVGSTRAWKDSDGTSGWTFMKYRYGYIVGAVGADGEELDCYLGPDEGSPWVFVVRQMKKSSGFTDYDEQKVMLGFPDATAAHMAYASQYNDERFFGGMATLSVADFRAELARIADGEPVALRHDAYADDIARAKRLIDAAERQMERDLSPADIDNLATFFARQTSQAQRVELSRQLSAALGVDVIPDEKYIPALLEYFTHENATLIGSIPAQLHQEVANLTARAFTKRMHPDTFADLIEQRFGVAESRARFIARDQLGKLWGQLNAVRQRGVGITHFVWETQNDDLVRPSHERLSGRRISYDDPPDVGLPGEDYNCVPAYARVSLHAPALKAFRRAYSGELTELVTDAGVAVHCTPNHPVLTARGWLAAHLVEVGDHLVEAPAECVDVLVQDPERGDATAEQVFGALALAGVAHRVHGRAAWFHGDSVDQEVDVVEVDRGLLVEREAGETQSLGDQRLVCAPASIASVGPDPSLAVGPLDASDGVMRGGGKSLAFGSGGVAHADEHRLAAASDLDARLDEHSPDDVARAPEPRGDLVLTHAGLIRADDLAGGKVDPVGRDDVAEDLAAELLVCGHRFRLAKVARVVRSTYDGFVYNFETATGWFGLHGLIVHNCRCMARPDVSGILAGAKDITRGESLKTIY